VLYQAHLGEAMRLINNGRELKGFEK
jgi:hypothetical protein